MGRPKVVVDIPEAYHAGPGNHPGTGSPQVVHAARGNIAKRYTGPAGKATPAQKAANKLFWGKVKQVRDQARKVGLAGEVETMAARPKVKVNVPESVLRKPDPEDAEANAAEDLELDGVSDDGLVGTWSGVLAVEGSPTGDGRVMQPGSLRWGDLPLPLRWMKEDSGDKHKGAVTVGRILDIRRDGRNIVGEGDLDLGSEEGRELARLMTDDGDGPRVNGVSVDLDEVDVEMRVDADAAAAMAQELGSDGGEPAEVDDDGRVTVKSVSAGDEMLVTTDARIRAATVCDIPAFSEARLQLTPQTSVVASADAPTAAEFASALVAGAGRRPPKGWFDDPRFGTGPEDDVRLVRDERTGIVAAPLTVTKDGRVYGHLAAWGSCHTGYSECVTPPTSAAAYRYFHVGSVETREGEEVATGRLTCDTLHAGRRMSAVDTLSHYENTGLAVADVRAGEDAHGIWLAGAIRPGVSAEQVRVLKASPPSGDWRRIGGGLELVAALAVNNPGFPVPRAMVASGVVTALQSVGVVGARLELSADDQVTLRELARRERRAQAEAARRTMMVASAAGRVRGP
jgi:hypothetical protein